jgi:anti-sigma regulatory factor (Ser/Thr protein kinase)
VLQPHTKELRWSNAGHPPALLVREGTATLLVGGAGVILGVTGGDESPEASVTLRDGDVLVLYTDGLIERRSESLSDGLARLEGVAPTIVGRTADETCDALLEALLPAGTARDDDVALLVVRVHADRMHRLDLAATPESAALARGFTAGVLEEAGLRDKVDTAVLLVSEIVTNALRHGIPPAALTITFRDDVLEVAVEDADTTMPVPRQPDPLDESGRGFVLVQALSADWGIRPLPTGKTTWFRLTQD